MEATNSPIFQKRTSKRILLVADLRQSRASPGPASGSCLPSCGALSSTGASSALSEVTFSLLKSADAVNDDKLLGPEDTARIGAAPSPPPEAAAAVAARSHSRLQFVEALGLSPLTPAGPQAPAVDAASSMVGAPMESVITLRPFTNPEGQMAETVSWFRRAKTECPSITLHPVATSPSIDQGLPANTPAVAQTSVQGSLASLGIKTVGSRGSSSSSATSGGGSAAMWRARYESAARELEDASARFRCAVWCFISA